MLEDIPLDVAFPAASAVARARYRPRERFLDLWWKAEPDDDSGQLYRYLAVPPDVYARLLAVHAAGGSVGEFANRRIKPFYDVER